MDKLISTGYFEKFNGMPNEDYTSWKVRVRAHLYGKGLLQVLDDDAETDPNYAKNVKLAAIEMVYWLGNRFVALTETKTPKQIFECIEEQHTKLSNHKVIDIRGELMSVKYDLKDPLQTHFDKMDKLFDKLKAANEEEKDSQKISLLIKSLPKEFLPVKMMLKMDNQKETSYTRVQGMVRSLHEEIGNEPQVEPKVLFAERPSNHSDNRNKFNRTQNNNRYNNNKHNNYNNRNSYNRENNAKFNHNKVKNMRSNPNIRKPYSNNNHKSSNNNNNNISCTQCGRRNHSFDQCRYNPANVDRQKKKSDQSVNVARRDKSPSFAFCLTDHEEVADDDEQLFSFLVDSGSTETIINNSAMANDFKELISPVRIQTAKKGQPIMATKTGQLNLKTLEGRKLVLKDVLYAAECHLNVISTARMNKDGYSVTFGQSGLQIFDQDGQIVIQGESINNFIKIKIDKPAFVNACYPEYKLWHDRLGHTSLDNFKKLKNGNFYDSNLLNNIKSIESICKFCIEGKQTRDPFNNKKDTSNVNRPLFHIHSDVCGKICPPTKRNENYFVTFIDQFTHYLVVYLIKHKSEVFECLKAYIASAEAQFNLKIAHFYCDNGGEYTSNEIKSYFAQKGIQVHYTCPHTPQQNGISERMNRTILERARAIRSQSELSKSFWGDAVQVATYLINRTPTKAITQDKTPFEMWHNKKPTIKYLRVFGSTAYVHNKVMKGKLDTRSHTGIFVGYEPSGYKIWMPANRKYVISTDVKFDETTFLVTRPTQGSNDMDDILTDDELTDIADDHTTKPGLEPGRSHYVDQVVHKSGTKPDGRITTKPGLEPGRSHHVDQVVNDGEQMQEIELVTHPTSTNSGTVPEPSIQSHDDRVDIETVTESDMSDFIHGSIDIINEEVTRPFKLHKTVVNDNVNAMEQIDASDLFNEDNNNRSFPISPSHDEPPTKVLRRSNRDRDENYLDKRFKDFILMSAHSIEPLPNSFKDIESRLDKELWQKAINEELNSMKLNNTWTIVNKPNNCNIVGCRWVFNIKRDEFGNPIKHKARLVAQGFSQQYLVDYNETFAPVSRMTSFRAIAAISNQFNLMLHHMDVKTAFLNGTLHEEIYMRIPDGVNINQPNKVCKLNRAIYGLKQAARCWFETFDSVIRKYGFVNSKVDRCIYILKGDSPENNIYLVLYVDDLLIATGNLTKMNQLKRYLMNKFSMVDLKEIKFFLGIKVDRTENKISLDQSAYIRVVLEKFQMDKCKPINTPLDSKVDYIALNSKEQIKAPCKSALGCLMYIMLCTRPDLCISVNICSRYAANNNLEVWKNLKRIMRYLQGTIDLKLTFTRTDQYSSIVKGFVDSDWGGGAGTDRRSTTGYLFKLFDSCTISWCSRKQNTVADSSTEAEYMALAEAVKESCWLRQLLNSIDFEITVPITLYEDNTGCINIAKNPSCHKNTKHIDIKYHITRERIENNEIALVYISTELQEADQLTKPLAAVRLVKLRMQLGME